MVANVALVVAQLFAPATGQTDGDVVVDAVAVCLVSIFVTLKVLWSNQISNVAPKLQ